MKNRFDQNRAARWLVFFASSLVLLFLACDAQPSKSLGKKTVEWQPETEDEKQAMEKEETGEPVQLDYGERTGEEETLDALIKAEKESMKKKKRYEKDEGVFFRYKDDSGQMHIVSELRFVPEKYRARAEAFQPREKPEGTGLIREKSPDIDEAAAIAEKRRDAQKARWERWRKRFRQMKKEIKAAERALEKAKNEKTDCQFKMLPISGAYDPNCQTRHEKKLKALKQDIESKKKRLEIFLDTARKAGVPKGYVR